MNFRIYLKPRIWRNPSLKAWACDTLLGGPIGYGSTPQEAYSEFIRKRNEVVLDLQANTLPAEVSNLLIRNYQ